MYGKTADCHVVGIVVREVTEIAHDWLRGIFVILLVDVHEFSRESVRKLSLTRNRKFVLISQSGWITLTRA